MSTLIKKRHSLLPGDTGKFAGILSGFILLLAVLPILTSRLEPLSLQTKSR